MTQKVSNLLPAAGGATGALIEALPNISSITQTIVLAAVGALVGYVVKIFLDWLFKRRAK